MRMDCVRWVLATCIIVATRPLAAAVPSATTDPSAAAAPRSSLRAEVVLSGKEAHSPALIALLRTVLVQQGVTPAFLMRQQWVDGDLLDDDPSRDRSQARIWITLPTSTVARLYFADPELRRFLVREVALRDGLDELGRERIAEVVESSTLALLHGARGMSRDEVRTSLTRRTGAATPASEPKQAPAPTQPPTRSLPNELGAFVGASYSGQWTGRHLDLTHGPGLRLGLELDGSHGRSWLGTALVERPFALVHEAPELRVRLQSTRALILFGWSQRIQAQTSFVFEVGGGAEFTRISPKAVSGADIDAASERTNVTRWFRTELGIEWTRAAWALMLAATCDLSLDDTHYDIERDGVRQRVFATAPLRPGALAGALYEF
jgi:hypothetical protein